MRNFWGVILPIELSIGLLFAVRQLVANSKKGDGLIPGLSILLSQGIARNVRTIQQQSSS